jgi:hypothetical protein
MFGCSAEWHLKRAQWKDPEIFTNDTIHDTVVTIYNPPLVADSLKLVDGDTIYVNDTVVDPDVINKEVNANPWMFVLGIFVTIIVFIGGIRLTRK